MDYGKCMDVRGWVMGGGNEKGKGDGGGKGGRGGRGGRGEKGEGVSFPIFHASYECKGYFARNNDYS